MSGEEESATSDKIGNVSDRVLDAFVNKLEAEEEYAEVASRQKLWCLIIRFRRNRFA